jgi:hypothetical protein
MMVGLFYGVIYAWLFGPVTELNRFFKGAVFGLAITAIALATMPVMMAMMGGGGAGNPCAANPRAAAANPCAPGTAESHNPCNPCGPTHEAVNPCAPESVDAGNPCNPCAPEAGHAKNACGAGAGNPCNPCGGGGAGNPCNPCGGGGGTFDGIISLINHLVFALVLAFVYRPRSA